MRLFDHYRSVLLGIVLLLGVACNRQVPMEVSLELSDYSTIDFPSSASEKQIQVQTNAKGWKAFPNASWLKVEQDRSAFTVRAEANKTAEARRAEILVYAEGTGATQ